MSSSAAKKPEDLGDTIEKRKTAYVMDSGSRCYNFEPYRIGNSSFIPSKITSTISYWKLDEADMRALARRVALLHRNADPVSGVEFGVKLETLQEIDAFLRGLDPRVVQVTASIAASPTRHSPSNCRSRRRSAALIDGSISGVLAE